MIIKKHPGARCSVGFPDEFFTNIVTDADNAWLILQRAAP